MIWCLNLKKIDLNKTYVYGNSSASSWCIAADYEEMKRRAPCMRETCGLAQHGWEPTATRFARGGCCCTPVLCSQRVVHVPPLLYILICPPRECSVGTTFVVVASSGARRPRRVPSSSLGAHAATRVPWHDYIIYTPHVRPHGGARILYGYASRAVHHQQPPRPPLPPVLVAGGNPPWPFHPSPPQGVRGDGVQEGGCGGPDAAAGAQGGDAGTSAPDGGSSRPVAAALGGARGRGLLRGCRRAGGRARIRRRSPGRAWLLGTLNCLTTCRSRLLSQFPVWLYSKEREKKLFSSLAHSNITMVIFICIFKK